MVRSGGTEKLEKLGKLSKEAGEASFPGAILSSV